MIPLRPQPGYLIVAKDALPGTVGEIILPEQHTLRPTSGTVIRPAENLKEWYPEGTKVVFGPFAGSSFTIPQGQYTILTDLEIQCTIEDPQ